MQFHFHPNQSHFRKNGFALRLTLKQKHKGTLKWPIFTGNNTTEGQEVTEKQFIPVL